MVRLTKREIETLLAAAGNVDPCMFDEAPISEKEAAKDREAWESGQEKLRIMLANRKR